MVNGPQQEQVNMQMARDMGEMKADMRTVKHDIDGFKMGMTTIHETQGAQTVKIDSANSQLVEIKTEMDKIFSKINRLSESQSKTLGFWAGVAAVFSIGMGAVLLLVRALWNHHL